MPITIEDVEALRRQLTELPRNRPREVNKQEAIALLASELSAAGRRGYKPDDLAHLLSERGLKMNAATLRGYLRRTRKKAKRRQASGETPIGASAPRVRTNGDSPTSTTRTSAGTPPDARPGTVGGKDASGERPPSTQVSRSGDEGPAPRR